MSRYVAFLRGMNLGGRRITNADLGAHFEAIGLADVATFRASGNVIFSADEGTAEDLGARLEAELAKRLAYEVPVFLRSAADVASIAAQRPFRAAELAASKGKLQVQLLGEEPTSAARREALAEAGAEDRLELIGRELYWLPSGGISESELDLRAIERALGPGTTRTMGTIEQIAARHCPPPG
ncbi:MAG TPA: DUF1697 domain-containing protein [Solirubrobacterales bacterium]|nr:DUF1697 domain-containing protein [Solirubrobacterales bacterium]